MENITIVIKEPIWYIEKIKNLNNMNHNYTGKAVGIDLSMLTDKKVRVKISHKDKYSRVVFPHIFEINNSELEKFPIQLTPGRPALRIIPLSEMSIAL